MKIYSYSLLSSTNHQAEKLVLTNSSSLPFVVTSLKQYAGEGRKGEDYYCPEGGLWFTLVDKYRNNVGNRYSMLSAVILTELLQEMHIKSEIKWPNDVLIDQKKIAGIMTKIKTDYISIGVGINTNIHCFGSIADTCTSVLLETGKKIDNYQLLEKFGDKYQKAVINRETTIEKCREKLIWIGSRVSVQLADKQIIRGIFRGITDEGFALIDQTIVCDGQLRLS